MGDSHLSHDSASQSPVAERSHPSPPSSAGHVRCAGKDKLRDRPWSANSDYVCSFSETRCLGGKSGSACILPTVSRSLDGFG